ncbi:MAG: UDP-N-acetylmuramoyl-L-alanine--D-glutamate ligase [Methylomonas sp.]|nr:UDP-N-acetylmuramoyl-L-alanine--D-glutamate ligase [Methylomonas sp.]PPD21567.1 MAG: UDP-N-acetylmuramoyl-L-alanine--D-glutamate ligase [Methylomonas sp.]PPD26383.1 MAG: UDP-N-acetylmuramoyl-L-alanine--D-glutamate ligase [Methylomonas sp.]PPD38122.1 MAG: UDP-N-acetylmuramoyl-L-alanine--D-glutamate ligase [Methylomonas sp.]PPD40477.1 MAG: UDP-N-acetylmuramoyl-L-alanine--D-glutamate ligase [Methylomonas sp.]
MDTAYLLDNLKRHFHLDPASARLLIVGLGATGYSIAQFLLTTPIKFAVIDSRRTPPQIDSLREQMPDVPVFCGGFDQSAFEVATHLLISPGISLNEKAIRKAVATGVVVLSDIDLFACATDKPVIAITGSNGKSTVTTLMGDMANAAGVKTAIGGNLGTPALDLLQQDAELYVLELSSFQLERTSALNARAATVLNLSPDHLDRHADMADYAQQKQRIFRGDGAMILNADDTMVMAMRESERHCLTFSVKGDADFHLRHGDDDHLMQGDQALVSASELQLEGSHNLANALAALALGHAVGLDMNAMCRALKRYKGLPHRMQRVADVEGVRWVNDSKATNIGACIAALEGYRRKVILIAGGDAKGADMVELKPIVATKAKAVILLGKDAHLIAQAIADSVPTHFADNMKQAVRIAANLAEAGDSVLLSPACASLDQYKSYADRGNQFAEAVMELT